MPVNKDVQNDVPQSRTKPMDIKSMPRMAHARCPRQGQNSRRTVSPNLVFLQSDSIRLVVSAAIIAERLRCSGDLNFWE